MRRPRLRFKHPSIHPSVHPSIHRPSVSTSTVGGCEGVRRSRGERDERCCCASEKQAWFCCSRGRACSDELRRRARSSILCRLVDLSLSLSLGMLSLFECGIRSCNDDYCTRSPSIRASACDWRLFASREPNCSKRASCDIQTPLNWQHCCGIIPCFSVPQSEVIPIPVG